MSEGNEIYNTTGNVWLKIVRMEKEKKIRLRDFGAKIYLPLIIWRWCKLHYSRGRRKERWCTQMLHSHGTCMRNLWLFHGKTKKLCWNFVFLRKTRKVVLHEPSPKRDKKASNCHIVFIAFESPPPTRLREVHNCMKKEKKEILKSIK